ncbi:hypothetical protein DFQ27_005248 [Actinomortierella ambigua]|uniref:Uncharacterized protein n=1 Tax=Actinomortierella ambigua TaxID=1343610 RepID=A0A9P6PZ96_9FUNG|nr:hypothetical protein DFQ27_005248 [Actinomortierella ambigua]
MTRCLNLVTIAVIAATTFLSTFAHGINVELTDKDGTTHSFVLDDSVCQEIPEGITAVSGKTDAWHCLLYKTSGCPSYDEAYTSFSGTRDGTTVRTFAEFTAKSISCEEF